MSMASTDAIVAPEEAVVAEASTNDPVVAAPTDTAIASPTIDGLALVSNRPFPWSADGGTFVAPPASPRSPDTRATQGRKEPSLHMALLAGIGILLFVAVRTWRDR